MDSGGSDDVKVTVVRSARAVETPTDDDQWDRGWTVNAGRLLMQVFQDVRTARKAPPEEIVEIDLSA